MNNILDSKVKRNSYIVIQGWMLTDLKLKGNELMVYAIVYGFSKDADDQWFTGSLQYIVDWTNSTKRTVLTCLQSLESKGLIEKQDIYLNNVKFCKYRAVNFSQGVNIFQGGGEKNSTPSENSSMGGSEKSSPNNLYLNNLNNNLINKNRIDNKNNRFIPPTIEEVAAYCQENDINVNPQRFVDYYTANGWKVGRNPMKDWKAAVRTWRANTWDNKEKTAKPKIDILPTSELMEEAKNKEAIKRFADFVKEKLDRDLTADELKEIENTVFNDTIEVVNHVITIISEKPTDNFSVLCELYREESMSYYLGINYN